MEYHVAVKTNELMVDAVTWVNLENMMLNERSPPQKTTCCMVALLQNVQKGQICRDRKSMSAGGSEQVDGGNGGLTANGAELSFQADDMFYS